MTIIDHPIAFSERSPYLSPRNPRPRGLDNADGPVNPEAYIDAARRIYADTSNDDIEVDDSAPVLWTGAISDGIENCWVQAWVHVRAEDTK